MIRTRAGPPPALPASQKSSSKTFAGIFVLSLLLPPTPKNNKSTMLIYQDIVSGDEMLSDAFDV